MSSVVGSVLVWLFRHVVLVIAKKEADAAGVAVQSEANALAVRRVLTTGILKWLNKHIISKKWAKEIKSDDQLAWFWQIVMKSDSIGEMLGEESISKARTFLLVCMAELGKPEGPSVDVLRRNIVAAGTILEKKNLFTPDAPEEDK